MSEAASCDVVVIGAGIAGLTAANRATQFGLRAIVLEKSAEEQYRSNSRYTYGTFHIHFTGVEADEAELTAKIETATEGFARKDLARAIARDGRRLMQWLREDGVGLVNLGTYNTNVLSPAWRMGFGLTWKGYAGDVALQKLEANLRGRQGRLLRGARASTIKRVPGGIEVDTDGGNRFRAAAVVIADGGFQASLDLIREHITPAADKLLQRNGGTAMGDGLRMAKALGAKIVGLENFYGHLHSRDAMKTDRLWPRPYADELAAAGIVVDESGHRVADEGFGGIWLSNAIARLPDPLATSAIFDQAIWDGPPGTGHVQPPNPLMLEAGATVHKAGTIAELAAVAGLPADRLQRTVDAYNAALDAGALQSLTPPRSGKNRPWPIGTPPFYALPLCAAITNTMGGIAVDGDGRVLDTSDKPIPGLFAAGSTIGGLNGGPHAGYVGGLINTVIGLRAAEAIAAAVAK
ncbi:MAG: FAD-dependent oxidoreductase [Alphaproteobacteria bacterium]|nr:FAD-dependent oxidoreductase [Alphaproteobacteria bacterium]